MRLKRARFNVLEYVLVVGMLAVLAAVFYPLFATADNRPTGMILNAAREPLPGAILRFRDETGRLVAVVTADEREKFRRQGLGKLSRYAIDGFLLTRFVRNTGGPTCYYFSPRGRQQAVFRDTSGAPVTDLGVAFAPDQRTWHISLIQGMLDRLTDKNGTARVDAVPVSARFEIRSRDRRYVVADVATFADRQAVRYQVTVIAPGTIAGRLVGPDNKPIGGYYAFATSSPDMEHGDHRYASAVTGPKGRFRITALLPGSYYVSARPPRSGRSVTPARRVVVASGQQAEIELRATALP